MSETIRPFYRYIGSLVLLQDLAKAGITDSEEVEKIRDDMDSLWLDIGHEERLQLNKTVEMFRREAQILGAGGET